MLFDTEKLKAKTKIEKWMFPSDSFHFGRRFSHLAREANAALVFKSGFLLGQMVKLSHQEWNVDCSLVLELNVALGLV